MSTQFIGARIWRAEFDRAIGIRRSQLYIQTPGMGPAAGYITLGVAGPYVKRRRKIGA